MLADLPSQGIHPWDDSSRTTKPVAHCPLSQADVAEPRAIQNAADSRVAPRADSDAACADSDADSDSDSDCVSVTGRRLRRRLANCGESSHLSAFRSSLRTLVSRSARSRCGTGWFRAGAWPVTPR
jgi:hypothetical protein